MPQVDSALEGWTVRVSRRKGPPADAQALPRLLDQPFAVGQTWVECGALGTRFLVLPERGLAVVLRGELYSHDLQAVLDLYTRHGASFAQHLEGSFALALVDVPAGHLWAVTDRMASLKVYAAQEEDTLLVSTQLNRPEFTRRPLSPAGVACAVASGVMLGDLTLYQGVRSLDRRIAARPRHPGAAAGRRPQPPGRVRAPRGDPGPAGQPLAGSPASAAQSSAAQCPRHPAPQPPGGGPRGGSDRRRPLRWTGPRCCCVC
ncbi:hypothetical protein HLB42_18810 (plasmid) [Deinococcus sp. D7000]|nr:hypothetical protein HLB42_18810 [Deinococcus sp. D7000]